jgi:tetratricopeptide (TPR) repeat protein
LLSLKSFSNESEEAEDSYKQAIELKPDYAEAYCILGNVQKELGRLPNAEFSYHQAINLKPDFALAHYNLATMMWELGGSNESKDLYKRSIRLDPSFAGPYKNLGVIMQELGELDEAEAFHRRSVKLRPNYGEAHRHLCLIKKFERWDEHLDLMQGLYSSNILNDEQNCHLCFALGKALDDLGDLGSSFKYYDEGNALRKKLLNYDINEDIQ